MISSFAGERILQLARGDLLGRRPKKPCTAGLIVVNSACYVSSHPLGVVGSWPSDTLRRLYGSARSRSISVRVNCEGMGSESNFKISPFKSSFCCCSIPGGRSLGMSCATPFGPITRSLISIVV